MSLPPSMTRKHPHHEKYVVDQEPLEKTAYTGDPHEEAKPCLQLRPSKKKRHRNSTPQTSIKEIDEELSNLCWNAPSNPHRPGSTLVFMWDRLNVITNLLAWASLVLHNYGAYGQSFCDGSPCPDDMPGTNSSRLLEVLPTQLAIQGRSWQEEESREDLEQ
ncbi:hypothetical protein Cgig2_003036 [Carnegiea gigantea]|uniref:Uncharacterized protein n=1 Tax=Carnegiea gigantea TaxID=171969 RepID=A0A9Q1K4T5_9CARY|nr:hypothetical protein Cgig2_003036 [Carnegiea gigantea]